MMQLLSISLLVFIHRLTFSSSQLVNEGSQLQDDPIYPEEKSYDFPQNEYENIRDKRQAGSCQPVTIANGVVVCDATLTTWTVTCNDFYHLVGSGTITWYPSSGVFPSTTTCEADVLFDLWPILLAIFIVSGVIILLLVATGIFWCCFNKNKHPQPYKHMNNTSSDAHHPEVPTTDHDNLQSYTD